MSFAHFYPRSPCGERHKLQDGRNSQHIISIHALLAESDFRRRFLLNLLIYFYPRSPCGERLSVPFRPASHLSISIHALLAESDDDLEPSKTRRLTFLSTLSLRRATSALAPKQNPTQHFYPRSPCGERLVDAVKLAGPVLFLSTLSLRRATQAQSLKVASLCNFYPRSPCGERPSSVKVSLSGSTISIHALLAESDSRPQRED